MHTSNHEDSDLSSTPFPMGFHLCILLLEDVYQMETGANNNYCDIVNDDDTSFLYYFSSCVGWWMSLLLLLQVLLLALLLDIVLFDAAGDNVQVYELL